MEKGKPEKSAVVVFESLVLGRAKNKQKDIVDEKGHFIKYETAQACSSKSIKDKSSKLNGENKGVKSEKEVPKIESNQTTFHKPKCTTKVVSEPTQGTPCSSKSIKSTKSVKKSGINN